MIRIAVSKLYYISSWHAKRNDIKVILKCMSCFLYFVSLFLTLQLLTNYMKDLNDLLISFKYLITIKRERKAIKP